MLSRTSHSVPSAYHATHRYRKAAALSALICNMDSPLKQFRQAAATRAGRLYVWVGSQALPLLFCASGEIAYQICKYDSITPLMLEAVDEGKEPTPLSDALRSETDGCSSSGPMSIPKLRAEYNQDFDTIELALKQEGGQVGQIEASECRAQDVWGRDKSGPVLNGGITAQRPGGIPPVVPPLQLNTFPISPPPSSRTLKS
jgi:hypothetical protein